MVFITIVLSLFGAFLIGIFYDYVQQYLQFYKFYQQLILFILCLSIIIFVHALAVSSITQIKALTTQVNTLMRQVELLEQQMIQEAKP